MSERYIKVFSGKADLYLDGAPLVIRANALLKDTQSGKMIGQLKLQSISEKVISYVKVTLSPLDAIGTPLGKGVDFEYLDLSVSGQEEFGTQAPIPLPDPSTRAFAVAVACVGFADGSVWRASAGEWQALDKNSAVAQEIEAEKTYKKALPLSKSVSLEDIATAKALFESIAAIKDVTVEIAYCSNRIAAIQEKKETDKRKRIKVGKWAAIIAGGAILLSLLGYFVAYPFIAKAVGNPKPFINIYQIEEYEIPDGVTSIGERAFLGCDSLTSVTIPDSVTWIGKDAFWYCDSLTSVTIPDNVTSIGRDAFYGCDSLTSVYITDLAAWCQISFGGDYANPLCYGANLYLNGELVKDLVIPDSVTSIGDEAFYDCDSLTSVTIPDSVTSIGNGAFAWCDNLTSVTIPGSVTSIGSSAFDGCTNIQTATIPTTAISKIPSYSLKTVVINGGTSIGDSAFSYCDSLTSVTIGGSVTSIDADAFYGCDSLTSVTIGGSITSIGKDAFAWCDNLDVIHYEGTKKEWRAIYKPYGLLEGIRIICTDGTVSP